MVAGMIASGWSVGKALILERGLKLLIPIVIEPIVDYLVGKALILERGLKLGYAINRFPLSEALVGKALILERGLKQKLPVILDHLRKLSERR